VRTYAPGVSEDAVSGHIQLLIPGETACFACAPPLVRSMYLQYYALDALVVFCYAFDRLKLYLNIVLAVHLVSAIFLSCIVALIC
jgi:hypothetical protein